MYPVATNHPASSEASVLETPISAFRRIGQDRTAQLARLKILTVADLFLHRPRRYEDRRRFLTIRELRLDTPGTVRGRVAAMGVHTFKKGNRSVFELVLEDASGRLYCRWWNLPFMQRYFRVGDEVFAYGKPVSMKPTTIDHPETEVVEEGIENQIHLNRIVPIYPLTEGLPQRWLRNFMWQKLAEFSDQIQELRPHTQQHHPYSRAQAVRRVHFPQELPEAELARQRLALDEFVELQLRLRIRRRNLEIRSHALPCSGDNRWIKPFLKQLGFKLTEGQTQVLKEIRLDLGKTVPMRRLLQGDVGCGKTVVAACAALMTLESGYSVAIMAPTEILAGQHHQNFERWLVGTDVQIQLWTGSRKTSKKPGGSTRSQPTLIIGTHALLEASTLIDHLGLVIIDEQHKFGVAQRETLLKKGHFPHLLVMTATPIPRTLGLTLYGDLDLSVIPQPPAGRGEIRTYVREADRLPKVWEFVREKLASGRQAYVVYPRVEDTGGTAVKSVIREHGVLKKLLAPFEVGLLHGGLAAEKKQSAIDRFRLGELHVLVATSVIEVGIDVPNASVMVIESAEQFGLAQLHQLRGRIGRGAHESFCILVTHRKTEQSLERLAIMERTRDGFQIAEADLQLRGPGELVGQDQSGVPDFKFADLRYDLKWVEAARQVAAELIVGENSC